MQKLPKHTLLWIPNFILIWKKNPISFARNFLDHPVYIKIGKVLININKSWETFCICILRVLTSAPSQLNYRINSRNTANQYPKLLRRLETKPRLFSTWPKFFHCHQSILGLISKYLEASRIIKLASATQIFI